MKKKQYPNLITDLRPVNNKPSGFKRLKIYSKKHLKLIIIVVSIVVIATGGVFLVVNHKSSSGNNKQSSGQKQIDETVSKVGKLILLPSGEQPTLAIINDASKYNNVTFFKNAANGDKLLVYAQAKEAILYRPSINKIIAVAPLNPNAAPQSTTPSQ